MRPKVAAFTVKHVSHIYPVIPLLKSIDKWADLVCYIDKKNVNIFIDNNLNFRVYPVDLGDTDYFEESQYEFKKFIIELNEKNYKKAHLHSLKQDLIASHTINKEYFELLLKDIEQENVDLIIRDTVDVYGAEIAKILNIKTTGYITNNLYNEEYFSIHEDELHIYFATLPIKEQLGNNYYLNFFKKIRKSNKKIEVNLNAVHVDCYHNYLLEDDYNLIFSTNYLQPQEAIPINNINNYRIIYPDFNKFKIEEKIPKKLKEFISKSKYIIYISTGSFHSEEKQFYKAIINYFANSKFNLVISCLKWDFEIKEYIKNKNLDEKIYVDNFIPQKYVLSCADLFFTSGGFNSILESIYYEVPIIVRPISCEQRMNGIIIEKNKLGVTLYKKNKKSLRDEVLYLMNNEEIKRSLRINSIDLKKHFGNNYEVINQKLRRLIND